MAEAVISAMILAARSRRRKFSAMLNVSGKMTPKTTT